MGKPVVGDIVVVPFPFSDLSDSKRRPALVVASLEGNDLILCMITSRSVRDQHAIEVDPNDLDDGVLPALSNIRPTRLFTADTTIVIRVQAHISRRLMDRTRSALVQVFSGNGL